MIKGFKEFIAQGNALEFAVAVIIGGAFKPIVDSITKVIMTIIGQLIGQPNFDSLGAFSLYQDGSYTFHLATAKELAANPDGFVMPGTIITTIINFLLIGIAVYFAIVMPMNKVRERMAKQKAAEEAAEVSDVELLTEIRDLLAAKAPRSRPYPRLQDDQPQCGGTSRRRRASLEPAPPGAGASRPSTGPLRASCS